MRIGVLLKNIVNLMLGIVFVLLGLRFILRLFGANASNDAVNWIYESSAEILGPFRNVFPSPNLEGAVIEFSTIFAMLVYSLIALLVMYLIDIMTPDTDVDDHHDDDDVIEEKTVKRKRT